MAYASTLVYGKSATVKPQNKIRYLLIVSTDSVKLHDTIKLLEVQTQILTQEVTGSNAFKVSQDQLHHILKSIVNKINEKNGGLGYSVSMTIVSNS